MMLENRAVEMPGQSFEDFAAAYHLITKRDSCGEPLIVPGNPRRSEDISHIYQHSADTLGLTLLFDTPLLWNNAKKKLTGLGFTVHQDGETEGVLLFSPKNDIQVAAAIKVAGLKRHRNVSKANRALFRENIKKAQSVLRAERALKQPTS